MPTVQQVTQAAMDFIADTDTADAKINGPSGTVTDRHGVVTDNLERILENIGDRILVNNLDILTLAELQARDELVTGRSVIFRGRSYVTVLAGTYTANDSTVIDVPASSRQSVLSPRETFLDEDELLADTRPASWFTVGDYISVKSTNRTYVVVASSGDLTTPGGLNLDPVASRVDVLTRSVPLDVRDFGALGNDNENSLVDETTEFTAAITQASAEKRELLIPNTQFLLSDLRLPAGAFNLHMRGEGASPTTIRQTQASANSGGTLIQFDQVSANMAASSLSATSDIVPNEKRIFLSDTSSLQPGMILFLESDKLWYHDNRGSWKKGEQHLISEVFPTFIEVWGHTWDAYDISSEILTIHAAWPDFLTMENFNIVGARPASEVETVAIQFGRCFNPKVHDVSVSGFTSSGIRSRRNWRPRMDNITLTMTAANGFGYGIETKSCVGGLFTNIEGRSTRRLFDAGATSTSGGPTRQYVLKDFKCVGGGYNYAGDRYLPEGTVPSFGVGMHGPSEHGVFSNGYISNVEDGITVRGLSTIIRNVVFGGNIEKHCISATFGSGLDVQGCVYENNISTERLNQGAANVAIRDDPEAFIAFGQENAQSGWIFSDKPTIIKNNSVSDTLNSFAHFETVDGLVDNLTIVGNDVIADPGSGVTWSFLSNGTGGVVEIADSSIYGNNITVRGTGSSFTDSDIRFSEAGIVIGKVQEVGGTYKGPVRVGERTWRFVLVDDDRFSLTAANLTLDDPIAIRLLTDDSNVRGDFVLVPGGFSAASFGLVGADLDFGGSSPPAGEFRLNLSASNILTVENNTGSTVTGTISIL